MSQAKSEAGQSNVVSVISTEVALQSFAELCEIHEIDIDEKLMSEEEIEAFDVLKRTLVAGFKRRRIAFDGDGVITFVNKFSEPNQLVMKVATGAVQRAVDSVKNRNHLVAKLHQSLAEQCGVPAKTFANMDYRDLKYVQAAFTLFMSS